MNKYLRYIPKKYHDSIKDIYQDDDGWWICLKCDGKYILDGYGSDYTIHEDALGAAICGFKNYIKMK